MNEKTTNKELQEKFHNQEFYNFLKEKGLILFETIVGSQAYGTATPESDIDKKFVYILPKEFIHGLNYIEQININKDYCGFEIRRFLELIQSNNPTLLELLNSPEDCIIFKHPVFDLVLEKRNEFISKVCKDSFGGYARQQIQKATGQDKMMNWESEKVTRRDPIDFCYVIEGHGTVSLKKWLRDGNMEQKFCGIVNVPNARDMYALYYDYQSHNCFSKLNGFDKEEMENNKKYYISKYGKIGLGYKGVQKEDDDGKITSNEMRLSSIPKTEKVSCVFSYNKDGYISHCRDYNHYQDWLKKRNKQRWVDVEGHGQKIDGKNMMHCLRLIEMSIEIAEGKGIIIRRPNAKELLDIRKGKVDLASLIAIAEEKIKRMDEMFNKSNLPQSVDREMINELLIKIRTIIYEGN